MDPGLPQPTPINIRLVQDAPAPVPMDDIPGPPGPPGPPEATAKHDAFYKYWDRFLAEKPSGKTAKALKKPKPKGQNGLMSLDMDVEGHPSHTLRRNTQGQVATQNATISYEQAASTCREKVKAIVNECRRLNVKYTDRNFMLSYPDALNSLGAPIPGSLNQLSGIGSVKRIEDIYEDPKFIVDGATANDVKQGSVGDCWFLAAITALSGKKDLIERVCVAQDEKVGVYGFVFFRDGEWISEVVDDKLALRRADDQRQFPTEFFLSVLGDTDVWRTGITNEMQMGTHYDITRLSKEYKESLRKGSNALYFASCRESNETWLPLLEKAYAKCHGDYQAISGGFAGEGIEDLTGGVSTYSYSESVLDKDKLWSELLQVNETSGFLFGCGSRTGRDTDPVDDEGFVRGHAYTVLDAREIKDPKDKEKTLRLLKIRNPWGKTEWSGAWSDGSKEWTADTLKELEHVFGDDGIFWISFVDWLKYFPDFERTRLFGPEWTVAQQWTSVNVPWNTEYLDTKFEISLEQAGPVVLVLSQPDSRYFEGLRGRYRHSLHFRLYKEGEGTYLVRSLLETGSGRSCSAELELEPGTYKVFVKIETWRMDDENTAEEVIKVFRGARRDKLLAVGKGFDLSHSKGRLREREDAIAKDTKDAQRQEDKDELRRRRLAAKAERARERARRLRVAAEVKRKRELKRAELLKERADKKAQKATVKAAKVKETAETAALAISDASESSTSAGTESHKVKAEEAKVDPTTTESAPKSDVTTIDASTGPEPAKPAVAPEIEQQALSPKTAAAGSTSTDSTPQATPESTTDEPLARAANAEAPETKETATETIAEAAKEIAEAAEKIVEATTAAPVTQDEKVGTEEDDDDEEDEIPDEELDVSEVDDNDFDWNSDVDGPAEVESDNDEDEPGMYANDPWNATCVIGLRIYSHCKMAKIRVIEHAERPSLGNRGVSKY